MLLLLCCWYFLAAARRKKKKYEETQKELPLQHTSSEHRTSGADVALPSKNLSSSSMKDDDSSKV